MSLRPGLALAQFAAHCPAYPREVIGCARAPGTRLAGHGLPPEGAESGYSRGAYNAKGTVDRTTRKATIDKQVLAAPLTGDGET